MTCSTTTTTPADITRGPIGRPPVLMTMIWRALAAAGPAGLLRSQLCAQLDMNPATCKQAVYRLRGERGLVINSQRLERDALYVLDAAVPPLPPPQRGEPTRLMRQLMAMLEAAGPAGVNYDDTRAAGMRDCSATFGMQTLANRGLCFGSRLPGPGKAKWTYFLTEQQLDAAVMKAAAESLERRRALARAREAAHRKAGTRVQRRPPKPEKVRPPKPVQEPGVILRSRRKPAPEPQPDLPVDYSRAKLTICPSGTDHRFTFTPPPGWRGEFGREWDAKRAGA